MPIKSHWFARCRRLAEMDFEELQVRARQEFAKRYDLMLSRMGVPFVQDEGCSWAEGCGHFFFEPPEVPHILEWLSKKLPEAAERILEQADRICEHRFDLLGCEDIDYGAEIDWHLDAVHNKRAPRIPWFRIRFLDFHQVGDAKVTWELNRHQHLVTLAKAFRLSGETRYVEELFRQWYHWQAQNPYAIGINWASSLEVAFRSLSWLWIWHLLKTSTAVPREFPGDLWRALLLNARHIERFLSTYFSPNTHLLGEGVALFFTGVLCSGFPAAQRWQRHGWQIVLNEAKRQVLPDGMHFEQSTYYHTYALDFFIHARVLAHANGVPIPAPFDRTIEEMMNVLCALGSAGPLPGFGDDDGGRVFDPRRNHPQHMLDPLATGAVLFNRADFKAVAGRIREETVWLLGTEGAKKFETMFSRQPETNSFALESSGIYVMSGVKPLPHQLTIDAGPHGAGRAGHGHADALSVQISVGEKALLIDPGTFAYVDSSAERNWFRGTVSHNTVQVDNLNQAESAGAFGWQDLPKTTVERWVTSESFDFFSGSHTGYRRLRNPVHHRRFVFNLKPCFWLIRDVLEGAGSHQLDISWHFAPGSLSTIPGGIVFLDHKKTSIALLSSANQDVSKIISQDGNSPIYGRKELSPVIRFSTQAHLPAEFATLLVPLWQSHTLPGRLAPFESRHVGIPVRAYCYFAGHSANYFFFAHQSGRWQIGPWASDAAFLFCSTNSRADLSRFVVCDGSYLEVNGQRIFTSKVPITKSAWLNEECVSSRVQDETTTLQLR